MKFKDLKVGQKFTRVGWHGIQEKINVPDNKSGKVWTHKEVDPPTGILACWMKDDNEVILVED